MSTPFRDVSPDETRGDGPWHRGMTRYQWFVLVVAALGWLFDCLDQQLFTLARRPAMQTLLASSPPDPATMTDAQKREFNGKVDFYGGVSTCIFMLGWATGGLIFGVVGDRFGRARTMMITIIIYSLCTGLSALSQGFWDFAFYRFITGLGVGGEFAVGVALVAEVMPERARPYALGLLQALSTVGNIAAALIGIGLGQAQLHLGTKLYGWEPWRWKFMIGALPAVLALVIRSGLQEPQRWREMKARAAATGERLGGYGPLFADRGWRKHALLGMLLACAGVIGLWGIGFFTPDLVRSVFQKAYEAQTLHATGVIAGLSGSGFSVPEPVRSVYQMAYESQLLSEQEIAGRLTIWSGVASMMIQVGAFVSMMLAARVCQRIGRKPFFAIAFTLALVSTAFVFRYLDEPRDIGWMLPIMGFCQLSIFAGYAIYFPELFPTRLRSTGTSFCYNVGRFIAAGGPFLLGLLTDVVYRGITSPAWMAEPKRPAGITMCAAFLLGLAVVPFLPETKGRPLPEG